MLMPHYYAQKDAGGIMRATPTVIKFSRKVSAKYRSSKYIEENFRRLFSAKGKLMFESFA